MYGMFVLTNSNFNVEPKYNGFRTENRKIKNIEHRTGDWRLEAKMKVIMVRDNEYHIFQIFVDLSLERSTKQSQKIP